MAVKKETDQRMPIAIVGLAGTFPGDASDPQKLWSVIMNKQSTRTEVPPDRFNIDAFYHPSGERNGTTNTRWAHFMKRKLAAFDAPFFSILPVEAQAMDVQSRMALECAYEALENAGIPIENVRGTRTGCYIASFTHDYAELTARDDDSQPKYAFTGLGTAMLSNRISWFLDIKGPSVTIDTACSSSLVALHMACQSIYSGEVDMMLVGGANVILLPRTMANQSSLGFLSEDGRSKAFDQRADGYARGEGVSFLVLKPLGAALRDGDAIRAVIRGTGVNQDGRTPGITVPSGESQEQLIRTVYERAGLDPSDTPFVEAHGTGTQKGDAVEARVLAKMFGHYRSPQNPVYIGSVKTNIGHLEAAAGVAQVIKTILALEKATIPPNIWFKQANPNIPLDEWHLKVPVESLKWPAAEKLRASINSFGYGGTNAHCILEAAEEFIPSMKVEKTIRHNSLTAFGDVQNTAMDVLPKLLLWSSHDKMGISRMALQYAEYLDPHVKSGANNMHVATLLCRTLSRRSNLPWKSYIISRTVDEMVSSFQKLAAHPVRSSKPPSLAFVFTGQGAQWPGMGCQLLCYPAFANSLRQADSFLLSSGMDSSLIDELMAAPESSSLHLPVVSQTLCTVLQVALVELLYHFGVKPACVVGHSGGEIAAAYAKGAISKEDAWTIAFHRGRLCSALIDIAPSVKGGMLVAGLNKMDCTRYIERLTNGTAVVACVNSPVSCTLAGDLSAIEQLEDMLHSAGHFHRRLRVDRAYHSPHMRAIAEECLKSISRAHPLSDTGHGPTITMYSTVTGKAVQSKDLTPSYWISNMIEPVEFVDAVNSLLTDVERTLDATAMVEIGPHSALKGPLRQILDARSVPPDCLYTSLLIRDKDAHHTILESMGFLAQQGYPVDMHRVNQLPPNGEFLVDVPHYPWNHSEHNNYWAESPISRKGRFRQYPRHDLCGIRGEDELPGELTWRHILSPRENPWILDHRVQGSILYPAAGILTAVLEAVRQYVDKDTISHIELQDVHITRPIIFSAPEDEIRTRLRLRRIAGGGGEIFEFRHFFQKANDEWELNCTGAVHFRTFSLEPNSHLGFPDDTEKVDSTFRSLYNECCMKCFIEPEPDRLYSRLNSIGLEFGPWFQNLVHIAKGCCIANATVKIPRTSDCMPSGFEQDMLIHPVVLDGLVQLGLNTSKEADEEPRVTMVPVAIKRICISTATKRAPGTRIVGYSTLRDSASGVKVDVTASDVKWNEPWILLEGLEFAILSDTPNSALIGENSVPRKLAAQLEWQLDIKYTPKAAIQKSCEESVTDLTVEEEKFHLESLFHDLHRGALLCIGRVLQDCPLSDVAPSPSHLRTLHQAMTQMYHSAIQGDLHDEDSSIGKLIRSNQQAKDRTLQCVAKSSIDGEIMHHHCRYLDQVLRGEMHSLQVLLEEGRLNRWYAEGITWRANHAKISAYLRLYAHKYPKANILEIGGGTGGLTLSALQAMTTPDGSALFDSYCFTDISGAFFEKAQQKFKHWVHSMNFTVLDIEKDIHGQGFEGGKFDLILADNVLHATKSIYRTLSSVKKLLKPNGQLVLSEITRNTPHITLTVGALEGWWLGVDDGRLWEPTLSVDRWDKALREAGFTGVDICLKDREGEHHIMSGMIATAKEDEVEFERTRVEPAFVLIHPETPTVRVLAFLDAMAAHLQQFSREAVTTESLARVAKVDLRGKSCLLLLDVDGYQSGMNLANINQMEWDSLKHILFACADVTWITSGATAADENPWASIALGLARSFRAENPLSAVTIIDLDAKSNFLDASTISIVAKLVIAGGLSKLNDGEPHDWEYCIRDGEVLIPRAVPDDVINDAVFNCSTAAQIEKIRFGHEDRSLALSNFQTMYFVDDPAYRSQPLKSDEVEIQVETTWVQDSRNPMPSIREEKKDIGIMGTVCGTVFRLGSAANATWSVGDRIMTFHRGAIRNFFRAPLSLCQKIPEQLGSFREAVRFPFIYSMAYYCLVHQASLKSGESILVHCQRDAFDEAVINLALQVGATVFLTASSQSQKVQLAKRYSLPQESIFNYKDTVYNLANIRTATRNRGVDVVFNYLHNALYPETSQYLAPGGRLVQLYSHRESDTSLAFTWPAASKSICVYLVSDQALDHEEPETVSEVFTRATQLFQRGAIQGLGIESWSPECGSDDCLHVTRTGSDRAAREMIFETNPKTLVPVLLQPPIVHLHSDATYIIAGGSGGLGIALARWMFQRGAKHIALLSRSPRSKPGVTNLEKEMNINGAHLVIIPCDITDKQEVHAAITQIGSSHPPVKGIIQAAMVLADSVYQNMTLESWNRAVRPKVHGSWNLHMYTPHEVDFFILLSSLVGLVGLRGQANYAAGNSFQDALASFRQSRGQTAVSLDVGFVDGAGFISNSTRRVGDNISKFSPVHIRQDEFLRMVEYAVINSDSLAAQVITGCGTGGMVMNHQEDADISDLYWFKEPRFQALAQIDLQHTKRGRGQSSQVSFSLRSLLATAVNVDEAAKAVLAALCRKLATSSSVAIEEIDPSRPLSSYGVDSLLAVDLRAYFASEAQSDISVFELTRDVPMTELARALAGRSKHISRDILH